MANKPLYVFIDESGDFNFSPSGSKVYTITATITHVPWEILEESYQLRYSVLAGEINPELGQEYLEDFFCHKFHASEDMQVIRDGFFKIVQKMEYIKAHSVVVRKNRTNPSIRESNKFYPKVVSSLLVYIFKRYKYSNLCISVDSTPVNKNKSAFIKAIKTELKTKQPKKKFTIYFPKSESSIYLQISDYINWAIQRKWEDGDTRSYDLIKHLLGTPELDMFRKGDTEYYQFKK